MEHYFQSCEAIWDIHKLGFVGVLVIFSVFGHRGGLPRSWASQLLGEFLILLQFWLLSVKVCLCHRMTFALHAYVRTVLPLRRQRVRAVWEHAEDGRRAISILSTVIVD